jgi:photosystem II stability/assembly factor-like uncharacterized protein
MKLMSSKVIAALAALVGAASASTGQSAAAYAQQAVSAASTAPVSPLSASFVSASTGWLLAGAECSTGCKLVMRKTVDGGRRWASAPAPAAPAGVLDWLPGTPVPASAVVKVHFANNSDGWAYEPGLWWTHDGGRHWARVNTHGWMVLSLASGDGRVIAAFGRDVDSGSAALAQVRVMSAPVRSDRWRPLPGAAGANLAWLGAAVSGRTGYVPAQVRAGAHGGGGASTELLAGPVDGSGRWHLVPLPCHTYWDFVDTVAASPNGKLALGCAGQPLLGLQQYKRVWVSANSGRTWHRFADLPMPGRMIEVSITSAGTVLESGYESDVYITWNGGKSWQTSPSLSSADLGDGLFATMITDADGYVLQNSYYFPQIYFTRNKGHTWKPVSVR